MRRYYDILELDSQKQNITSSLLYQKLLARNSLINKSIQTFSRKSYVRLRNDKSLFFQNRLTSIKSTVGTSKTTSVSRQSSSTQVRRHSKTPNNDLKPQRDTLSPIPILRYHKTRIEFSKGQKNRNIKRQKIDQGVWDLLKKLKIRFHQRMCRLKSTEPSEHLSEVKNTEEGFMMVVGSRVSLPGFYY